MPVPKDKVGMTPREQLLDAAGRLFVKQGFAGTSTREIADEVGIRQASIYHHVSGKDGLLAELLAESVRPTLDRVALVEQVCADESAATVLYALALVDVRTLVDAPHNAGLLARLPEVTNSPAFADYRMVRAELVDTYTRLAEQVSAEAALPGIGELLVNLVETVISIRRRGEDVTDSTAAAIAAGCLRVAGASADAIELAALTAAVRLSSI